MPKPEEYKITVWSPVKILSLGLGLEVKGKLTKNFSGGYIYVIKFSDFESMLNIIFNTFNYKKYGYDYGDVLENKDFKQALNKLNSLFNLFNLLDLSLVISYVEFDGNMSLSATNDIKKFHSGMPVIFVYDRTHKSIIINKLKLKLFVDDKFECLYGIEKNTLCIHLPKKFDENELSDKDIKRIQKNANGESAGELFEKEKAKYIKKFSGFYNDEISKSTNAKNMNIFIAYNIDDVEKKIIELFKN